MTSKHSNPSVSTMHIQTDRCSKVASAYVDFKCTGRKTFCHCHDSNWQPFGKQTHRCTTRAILVSPLKLIYLLEINRLNKCFSEKIVFHPCTTLRTGHCRLKHCLNRTRHLIFFSVCKDGDSLGNHYSGLQTSVLSKVQNVAKAAVPVKHIAQGCSLMKCRRKSKSISTTSLLLLPNAFDPEWVELGGGGGMELFKCLNQCNNIIQNICYLNHVEILVKKFLFSAITSSKTLQ